VQFILPGHSPDRPVPGCIPERERGAGMSSEDYCRGFDNGHKMGFEAGFQAALFFAKRRLDAIYRSIDNVNDALIEERYLEWFGKPVPGILAKHTEEAEA